MQNRLKEKNMNFERVTIIAAILTIAVMLIIYGKSSSAQEQIIKFEHVIALSSGQGSIRFFDKRDGRVYTYDRTLQRVMRIVQIEQLGQPAKIIQESLSDRNLKY